MLLFRSDLTGHDVKAILVFIKRWWIPEQREIQQDISRSSQKALDKNKQRKTGKQRVALRFPELYVLLFSFLLNLVWEFLQAPFFVFSQQASVYSLSGCLLFCSGVDSIMTLTAYCVMACVVRDRYWFLTTTAARWGSFIGVNPILS